MKDRTGHQRGGNEKVAHIRTPSANQPNVLYTVPTFDAFHLTALTVFTERWLHEKSHSILLWKAAQEVTVSFTIIPVQFPKPGKSFQYSFYSQKVIPWNPQSHLHFVSFFRSKILKNVAKRNQISDGDL